MSLNFYPPLLQMRATPYPLNMLSRIVMFRFTLCLFCFAFALCSTAFGRSYVLDSSTGATFLKQELSKLPFNRDIDFSVNTYSTEPFEKKPSETTRGNLCPGTNAHHLVLKDTVLSKRALRRLPKNSFEMGMRDAKKYYKPRFKGNIHQAKNPNNFRIYNDPAYKNGYIMGAKEKVGSQIAWLIACGIFGVGLPVLNFATQ